MTMFFIHSKFVLYRIHDLQVFPPSLCFVFSFSFLTVAFQEQTLTLMKSSLSVLFFYKLCFSTVSKKSLPKSQRYCPMFSWKSFITSCSVLKSAIDQSLLIRIVFSALQCTPVLISGRLGVLSLQSESSPVSYE